MKEKRKLTDLAREQKEMEKKRSLQVRELEKCSEERELLKMNGGQQ